MLKVEWLWTINNCVLFYFQYFDWSFGTEQEEVPVKDEENGRKIISNRTKRWRQQHCKVKPTIIRKSKNILNFSAIFDVWHLTILNYFVIFLVKLSFKLFKKSFVINMNGMSLKSKQFEDIKTTMLSSVQTKLHVSHDIWRST